MARILDYKIHPQPCSLVHALEAARVAGLRGHVVLDPFCGTGTLLVAAHRAGARKVIGSDIENWGLCVRRELDELLRTALFTGSVEVHWGVDAFEAVDRFSHDVLFTDPPDPKDILGGRLLSAVRDTGLTGAQLRRYLAGRLHPGNLMGRKQETISYVVELVKREVNDGKRVIVHAYEKHWARGCRFSWASELSKHFSYRQLPHSYIEITDTL